MLLNAKDFESGDVLQTDICIVGAGAAGISLAMELINSPFEVTILEAGYFQADQKTQSLYQGSNEGLPYYPLEATRLRFFGGTTNHWSGWSRPYSDIDFAERKYIQHSGWPVTEEEMSRFYPSAGKYCQMDAASYDAEDNEDYIPKFFGSSHPSKKLVTRVWHRGPPTLFGEVYRDQLVNAKNIKLVLGANVVELILDQDGKRITDVKAKNLDSNSFSVQAKNTVLCMGGIAGPRLLLASQSQSKKGIGNERDMLGRFFMLHPQLNVGKLYAFEKTLIELSVPERVKRSKIPSSIEKSTFIRAGLSLTNEMQKKFGLPNHAILFRGKVPSSESRFTRFKRGIKNTILGDELNQSEAAIKELMLYVKDGHIGFDFYNSLDVELRMDHLPNVNSRIVLSDERDFLGVPKPILNWQTKDQDFEGVKQTCELLAACMAELKMGRFKLGSWLYDESKKWPEDTDWDFHHMGATRMSETNEDGVVDKNCKVHGVDNLYVVSSSIFSTASFSNPTLTIIAFSVRLAAHLKREPV